MSPPWSVPRDLGKLAPEPERADDLRLRVEELEAEVRRLNSEVERLRMRGGEAPTASISAGGTVVTYVGPPPAFTEPSAPAPFDNPTTCTEIVALPSVPDEAPLTLEATLAIQLGEASTADVTTPVASLPNDVTEVVAIDRPPRADRRETPFEPVERTIRVPRFTSQRLTLELKEIASLGWMRGIPTFIRRVFGSSVMPGEIEELELAGVRIASTWRRQVLHGLLLGGTVVAAAACVDLWLEQWLGVSFLVNDLMAHVVRHTHTLLQYVAQLGH